MRLGKIEKKTGEWKITFDRLEDLWHLGRVLTPGDQCEAVTYRKFKATEDAEAERKKVTIRIKLEKFEFNEYNHYLRLSGPIVGGSPEEYVQLGQYHTIELRPMDWVKIYKDWTDWQVDLLLQAQKESNRVQFSIILLDEDEANVYDVYAFGIRKTLSIKNEARKRGENFDSKQKEYFEKIAQLAFNSKSQKILIAGPGFTKDGLRKRMLDLDAKFTNSKCFFTSANHIEMNGVNELIGEGAVEKVMQEHRLKDESKYLQEFLKSLGKEDGLSTYGLKGVAFALEISAIKQLLVLDKLVLENIEVSNLVDNAIKRKIPTLIYSNKSDFGQRLDKFGGIVALLHYKID